VTRAWVALAMLALTRVVLASAHGTWAWSLDTLRFTPAPALAIWALLALALIPAVARRGSGPLAAAGDTITRRPWLAAAGLALVAAALVWLHPDRTGWIGDAVIRKGAVEDAGGIGVTLFPQASRLDLLLHLHLPRALADAGRITPAGAVRVIDAFEAGLLGVLAVAFARATGFTGAGATLAAAAALMSPALGLFTGYNKSFSEVVVASVVVTSASLAMLRGRRADPWLAAGLVLAAFAHRSGLALAPAALVAWVLAGRAEPARWRAPRVWLSCGLAVAGVGLALAEAAPVLRAVDVGAHLTPHEPGTGGTWWRGVFAGTRPADFANVVLGLPPLAIAALAAGVSPLGTRERRDTASWFAVVLATWGIGMLLIHPAQGFVRDYDDVAAFVTLIGLAAAWGLGPRIAHGAALATPAIVTAAVATVLWLAVPTHPAAGLARVHAFVTEPPPRSPDERAASWEFLGMRAVGESRWNDAAVALEHAVTLAPAPGTMREWALAEIQIGHPERAIEIYRTLLARDPRNVMAWYSLAAVSTQVGDYPSAARALRSLLVVAPGDSAARQNLRLIEQAHPETRETAPR